MPCSPIQRSPCQGSAPTITIPGGPRPVLHSPRAAGKVLLESPRAGQGYPYPALGRFRILGGGAGAGSAQSTASSGTTQRMVGSSAGRAGIVPRAADARQEAALGLHPDSAHGLFGAFLSQGTGDEGP